MGDNELLLDEDSEVDPLTLRLADPVMQLEDVGDSDEDAAGELEGDTDALGETESVWVTVEENILLLDEDSEGDSLLLGLTDPVMQLEDVGDADEDAAGELEGDTDAL